MKLSYLAIPLAVALTATPALAHVTRIAELGTAPLLGQSASTAQMRARVAHNEGLVSAAAERIGLTSAQYAEFRQAIDSSQVAYVTVPRHLEAMTWQAGGHVYALHDVIIPANTHGWEVDIPDGNRVLALYMPAKCGNLSMAHKPARVIAQHHRPTRVAALKVAPPVAAPVAVAPAAAVIPDDTPVAAPQVAAAEFPPAVAAAGSHGLGFLPLLLGVVPFIAGGGSHLVSVPAVTTTPSTPPMNCGCPPPPCP